jgi:hypothetical protein
MARVGPAGKPDDNLGFVRKVIDNFPLAFVSPLSAYYYYFHGLSLS